MKARQTRYAAYATLYIIVILCVIAAANYLANRYNKSYDATANKRFTLSDQTAKVVRELKNDVRITYWDKSTNFQQGQDLLDRYSNLSRKVHVEFVDPFKQPQAARAAGIKNIGTATIDIGAKHEEAKTFDEEGITGAVVRALKGGQRMVCFIQGNGEHQLDDTDRTGFSQLKTLLEGDNYASKAISLLTKAEVPSDCTAVVVGGPATDLAQPEVDALKKLVEDGGRVLFLLDPPLRVRGREIADNAPLDTLLTSWGVTPEKDLVLDENPIGQLAGLGPEVPLVMNYESHAIVAPMKGTATGFPLTRALDTKSGDKTTVDKLFSSSDGSFATTNLGPGPISADPKQSKPGPFTLAAAGIYSTGQASKQGRFVVVGNSAWAANGFIRFNGNRDLALNMMNWLSSDEDLISIRPKEPEDRRITVTRAQMTMIRSVSQFLLPIIVIVAGIAVWWRRR
ncbi:MAG TPA: GldG family protein [Bryobacteraceae bacterium]|nr:GldG family protein [Bryobacteraceae bacterium]